MPRNRPCALKGIHQKAEVHLFNASREKDIFFSSHNVKAKKNNFHQKNQPSREANSRVRWKVN
jgi:hypothetical protein